MLPYLQTPQAVASADINFLRMRERFCRAFCALRNDRLCRLQGATQPPRTFPHHENFSFPRQRPPRLRLHGGPRRPRRRPDFVQRHRPADAYRWIDRIRIAGPAFQRLFAPAAVQGASNSAEAYRLPHIRGGGNAQPPDVVDLHDSSGVVDASVHRRLRITRFRGLPTLSGRLQSAALRCAWRTAKLPFPGFESYPQSAHA